MPKIFISYRRADLPDLVDRIFEGLISHFGKDAVFRDVDGIEPATDFARKIGEALRECAVLVALIGPDWLAIAADGKRGIDDEDDWVRTELSIAMTIGVPVVPVVLNRAVMPKAEGLPRQLRDLSKLQALQLESGRSFSTDIQALIKTIDRYMPGGLSRYFSRFKVPIKSILVVAAILLVGLTAGPQIPGLITRLQTLTGASSDTRIDAIRRNEETFAIVILQQLLRPSPNGPVNLENQNRMKQWLADKSLSITLTQFLSDAKYAAARMQMVHDLLSAPLNEPTGRVQLNLPPEKLSMARLIATRFEAAGFGRNQQLAAAANAFAESGLDPNARVSGGEDAVGLFLLNRTGGLGAGYTVSQLMDPATNIDIAIQEARKSSSFAAANTLEDAVSAFVRTVERPANLQSEIPKRFQIAKTLEPLI